MSRNPGDSGRATRTKIRRQGAAGAARDRCSWGRNVTLREGVRLRHVIIRRGTFFCPPVSAVRVASPRCSSGPVLPDTVLVNQEVYRREPEALPVLRLKQPKHILTPRARRYVSEAMAYFPQPRFRSNVNCTTFSHSARYSPLAHADRRPVASDGYGHKPYLTSDNCYFTLWSG